uniref:FLYWCH-type domain-containing protein n=1 Tax=Ditylenchus dipsaci TaxID=166011 RepID=A0A915ERN4_9BILA
MSKKGRDMVEYDGYLYTFRYNRGNGDVVYSCKHHRGGCMAKVVLNNNNYKMETITEHSHEADPVDVGKLQVYQEALRISMANRKISPRDVKDAKNYPPGARNFQDVEIPEGWKCGVQAKAIRVRDPLLQNERSKTSNPAIILALVDATENFNSENVRQVLQVSPVLRELSKLTGDPEKLIAEFQDIHENNI